MARQRLDKLLVERGLAASRERAQALVLAGRVLVNDQKVEKPGAPVAEDAALRMLGNDLRYVSRGGVKLEAALVHWQMDLTGRTCVDIGASTGGFTDCMLQHGAARVHAVDTGYGQMAHSIRTDARVTLAERTNARLLTAGELPHDATFLAMDVSFISATLVLPAVIAALGWQPFADKTAASPGRDAGAVILVKPQFEAGREAVGKGGIVREESARQAAIARVTACVTELGGRTPGVIPSPITGAEGNVEYLLHTQFGRAS